MRLAASRASRSAPCEASRAATAGWLVRPAQLRVRERLSAATRSTHASGIRRKTRNLLSSSTPRDNIAVLVARPSSFSDPVFAPTVL